MNILGIHGGFTLGQHDAGAALVKSGKLIAVCEEERFLRIKSARGQMPIFSIHQCLKEGGLKITDIDLVMCPGETYDHLEARLALFFKHYFGHVPKIKPVNHQLAHLASAYYASGWDRALCVSYDFRGDRLSTAMGVGENGKITLRESIEAQNSLGLFYAMLTQFLGFSIGEDEYKLMGLAPYGQDNFDLSPILKSTEGGGFLLNQEFVRQFPPITSSVEPIYTDKLLELLGPPRAVGEPISQRHKDLACSTQRLLERCLENLISGFHKKTGISKLCVAGGVALNCSANGKLRQLPFVSELFVQPASSDRGLPLGCAYLGAAEAGTPLGKLDHVYWGATYTESEIEKAVRLTNLPFHRVDDPSRKAAELLAQGKVIGWFQGRSEFGPRALGNRSILADPRSLKMKDLVNVKIKFREEFRPFAPACVEEAAEQIFELNGPSPFMTFAVQVRPDYRDKLGAVTHVDGTARVQTVSAKHNPLFHSLISEFGRLTGVPVVLNTSFNIKGQPIVEAPLDAVATFASTGIDALFVGNQLMVK